MTEPRTVRDRLRAQYFELIPSMQRTLVALEADVRYHLRPVMIGLNRYEQVRIVSRLKECESAVDALRRKDEMRTFDPEKAETYSLLNLRDLVGLRVLVFPKTRIEQVRSALEPLLDGWSTESFSNIEPEDAPIAMKFHGVGKSAGTTIAAEVQVVSSLIGSFWDVEHAAVYKTSPNLQGVMASPSMRERYRSVLRALRDFEDEFERLIREASEIDAS